MKVAQVMPVAVADYQAIGVDMQREIDFGEGLVIGFDLTFTPYGTTQYTILQGLNSTYANAIYLNISGSSIKSINLFYTFGGAETINIPYDLSPTANNRLVFYFLRSGSTISVDFLINRQKVGRFQTTLSSDIRKPRHIGASFLLRLLVKSSVLIVDTGIKADAELMGYFDLLEGLNCDSQMALNLINSLIPYADKGQLFGSILNTYTNSQNINFDSDFVSLITSFLTSQGFNVVNYPLFDYKNEVEAIGIYPLNPYSIEESGPDQIKTSSIIVEIQAGSNSRLLEIIEAVRGVVDLLNFSTPAKIIREEIWKPVETGINMGFARLTVDFKTFRRRE